MSGLISLSANKATSGLKVNVVNTSNINLHKNIPNAESKASTKAKAAKQSNESYPEVTLSSLACEESIVPKVYSATTQIESAADEETVADYTNSEKLTAMTNEIAALKLIINILQNNPFYLNKFVVADDTVLMEVVKLLTNADDIVMDAEDIGQGCISKKSYRKVNAIYVVQDGETKNLKYSYPNIVQELTELHISFKYVW